MNPHEMWHAGDLEGLRRAEQANDLDRVAALLGQPRPLIDIWASMGMTYRILPDAVEVLSYDRVVGRQALSPGGERVGPYVVVVSELTDEEIAQRDADLARGAAGEPVPDE